MEKNNYVFELDISRKVLPNQDLTKILKFDRDYNKVFVSAISMEDAITKLKNLINDETLILYSAKRFEKSIVIQ